MIELCSIHDTEGSYACRVNKLTKCEFPNLSMLPFLCLQYSPVLYVLKKKSFTKHNIPHFVSYFLSRLIIAVRFLTSENEMHFLLIGCSSIWHKTPFPHFHFLVVKLQILLCHQVVSTRCVTCRLFRLINPFLSGNSVIKRAVLSAMETVLVHHEPL